VDILADENIRISTFADDTIILASREYPVTASTLLQNHLNLFESRMHNWIIKINEAK